MLIAWSMPPAANVAVVNLGAADRAHLQGLDQPSREQDWLEPGDWTPAA
jgi:hypothetical protein